MLHEMEILCLKNFLLKMPIFLLILVQIIQPAAWLTPEHDWLLASYLTHSGAGSDTLAHIIITDFNNCAVVTFYRFICS